jgi:hypothetical protein
MPEYLSPGVYIQEVHTGPRPIEGVGTSVAAFVGFTPYRKETDPDKLNKPRLITSWSQYVEEFGTEYRIDGVKEDTRSSNGTGDVWKARISTRGRSNPYEGGYYLAHAIYGYFANGGGRCYVYGILRPPEATVAVHNSNGKEALFTVTPKLRISNPIEIRIEGTGGSSGKPVAGKSPAKPASSETSNPGEGESGEGSSGTAALARPLEDTSFGTPPGSTRFTLKVVVRVKEQNREVDREVEVYRNLSLSDEQGRTTFLQQLAQSQLIAVELEPSADLMRLSGNHLLPQTTSQTLHATPVTTRNGYNSGPQPFIGDKVERTGLEGMVIAEDVNMVCCPDLMYAYKEKWITSDGVQAVQDAMIAHCTEMGDRMAILDPLPELETAQQVLEWRTRKANFSSPFAALYYPWIEIINPQKPAERLAVPPSGHIAGIYARNDRERGVHKAPANEVVRGALKVSEITKGEQDELNPHGINCIRAFPGRGIVVWGARTLAGPDNPQWRYVNVRRLFNYVEKSIERGTQWVVFEPNNHDLWARITRDIRAFLTARWREGMLFGKTPEEAFYVKCDEELNPPEIRNEGKLIIEIGLAPVKPAEFVIFRFSQLIESGANT